MSIIEVDAAFMCLLLGWILTGELKFLMVCSDLNNKYLLFLCLVDILRKDESFI